MVYVYTRTYLFVGFFFLEVGDLTGSATMPVMTTSGVTRPSLAEAPPVSPPAPTSRASSASSTSGTSRPEWLLRMDECLVKIYTYLLVDVHPG